MQITQDSLPMRIEQIQRIMKGSKAKYTVLFGKIGNVVTYKLNKPKALNALDQDMMIRINFQIEEWEENKIPAVIFSGEGGKALCAGGDVKSLYFAKTSPSEIYPPSLLVTFFSHGYKTIYAIATMKPILIALMDGIVMGGGVGLSINAPIRIATETSMFAMPEGRLGFFTDVGGGYFLSRLKNNLGMFLGLTGHILKGADLYHAGLADYYVPRERLNSLVQEIGKSITTQDQVEDIRKIVTKYHSKEVFTIQKPPQVPDFSLSESNLQVINDVFEDDDFSRLLNKLRYNFNKEFTEDQLFILEHSCPISMRVIFEQIKRGKHLDLKQNLMMDFRIVARFMQGQDFFEGVKRILVDKTHIPQWTFKVAEEIPAYEVEKYFAPLQNELYQ